MINRASDALRIRRIQESDVADLAALERTVFSDPWTENGIKETLSQDHTLVLGIRKDCRLIGYVILYYVPDEGEIARIAVESAWRRRGVAGHLLAELEKICIDTGIRKLMLEVRRNNTAAVSFYKKNGFRKDGVRKGYYTNPCEDAILMSKELMEGLTVVSTGKQDAMRI